MIMIIDFALFLLILSITLKEKLNLKIYTTFFNFKGSDR